ncbi:MAG: hypothetical protein ABIH53_00380 [archaeon]
MDWFTSIPRIFLVVLVVIVGVTAVIFIVNLDFGNPDNVDENLEKTTGYLAKNVIPTEINWISWITNKLSNHPLLLISSILTILWLFGYFLPKKS